MYVLVMATIRGKNLQKSQRSLYLNTNVFFKLNFLIYVHSLCDYEK